MKTNTRKYLNIEVFNINYFDVDGNEHNQIHVKYGDFDILYIDDLKIDDSRNFRAVHNYNDIDHRASHKLYEMPVDDIDRDCPDEGRTYTGIIYKIKRINKYCVAIIKLTDE